MKTNVFSISLIAGTLTGAPLLGIAQSGTGEPNPVISSPRSTENSAPAPGTQSATGTQQPTTGSRITTAVENLLGKFLGRNQAQVPLEQLPQAAQDTIRNQAGTEPIENVSQINVNGQTAYAVTFKRNGQDVQLQVDPSGRILNNEPNPTLSSSQQPLTDATPVGFYQLPDRVQTALTQASNGERIDQIEQGMIDGQTVYEAQFRQNGRNVVLRFNPNGSLMSEPMPNGQSGRLAGIQNSDRIGGSAISRPDWRTAPVRQPLSDAHMVQFRSLPQSVRDTFLRYAGTSRIGTVQQGTVDGQSIYQAQVRPSGTAVDLRVTAGGTLMNDQVNDRFLAEFSRTQDSTGSMGRAAGWQSGQGGGSSSSPLSYSAPISFNQLPLAAQTTVEAQAGGAGVDSVSQGTLNGQTVYDVVFHRDGQRMNVRVAEDGSILSSQGGAR